MLSLNINKNPLLIQSLISTLEAPIHNWAFRDDVKTNADGGRDIFGENKNQDHNKIWVKTIGENGGKSGCR